MSLAPDSSQTSPESGRLRVPPPEDLATLSGHDPFDPEYGARTNELRSDGGFFYAVGARLTRDSVWIDLTGFGPERPTSETLAMSAGSSSVEQTALYVPGDHYTKTSIVVTSKPANGASVAPLRGTLYLGEGVNLRTGPIWEEPYQLKDSPQGTVVSRFYDKEGDSAKVARVVQGKEQLAVVMSELGRLCLPEPDQGVLAKPTMALIAGLDRPFTDRR